MLFPITAVTLILSLTLVLHLFGGRNALAIGLAAWTLEVALGTLPIFQYTVAYSVRADVVVASCLLGATASYVLVRRPALNLPAHFPRAQSVRLPRALAVVGILGGLLLIVDAHARGMSFSVGYLLSNLTTIRASVFDDLEYGVVPSRVAIAGSYLAACTLLAAIHFGLLGRKSDRLTVAVTMAAIATTAVTSLLVYGGRAELFHLVSVIGIGALLSGRRLFRLSTKRVLVASLAVLCTWYFAVAWVQKREQNPDTAYVMATTQRAALHPWLAPRVVGNGTAETAFLSLGYFASPLPTLAFYLERPHVPGPLFGAYSYPLPTRVAARMTGRYESNAWYATRVEVFRPIESAGYPGNVWATWIRDLIVDFGVAGAIAFCAAFAAFMAWARNRFERTSEIHYYLFEVIAAFTFAFGAFQNVLWFTSVASAFFITVALAIAAHLRPTPVGRLAAGARVHPATFAGPSRTRRPA